MIFVTLPDTPPTVTVNVPVGAVALAVKVSKLLLATPSRVTGFGKNVAVTPFGRPEALNVTLPEKPAPGPTQTWFAPMPPCTTVTIEKSGLRMKFTPLGSTTTQAGMITVILPDTPLRVMGNVPVAAVALAVKVSVLVEVVGFGLKAAVTPLGRPETLNVTLPEKPFHGVMLIWVAPLPPGSISTAIGEAGR